MTGYPFRPISSWPGEQTPRSRQRTSPFQAGHARTIDQLRSELDHLRARDVVIEVALREQDIRIDGLPRAGAPHPDHPGVVVSFDSKHGPLRYATDVFTTWQANLRAIALGLEALRKVERYGITKRGEQYVGWKAIAAASQSADEARSFLQSVIGHLVHDLADDDDRSLVREARRQAHPDSPDGDHDTFLAVQHAAETLGVA